MNMSTIGESYKSECLKIKSSCDVRNWKSQVSMKYDALCRAHLGQLLQSDGVDENRTINGDTLIYLCDNQLIFIMFKPHRKWLDVIKE